MKVRRSIKDKDIRQLKSGSHDRGNSGKLSHAIKSLMQSECQSSITGKEVHYRHCGHCTTCGKIRENIATCDDVVVVE